MSAFDPKRISIVSLNQQVLTETGETGSVPPISLASNITEDDIDAVAKIAAKGRAR
jgi:hypothetical protein